MSPPEAEIEVDAALVQRLLVAQHPDLAVLPIQIVASGWDNVLARLGDDLVARLPRRSLSAALVEHEQAWLPRLARQLPVEVPVPVRIGLPDEGYPWRWSICRWLEGTDVAAQPPDDLHATATDLGGFIAALQAIDPTGAPRNPYRGVPLGDRDDITRSRLAALAEVVDAPSIASRWAEHVAVPAWEGEPVLVHGDLHPGNLLVRDGRLTAVLDFGDITAGDPATDLDVAWMLLRPVEREVLREAVGGVDDDTWRRARGWALSIAIAILADAGEDRLVQVAHRTLDAVLADDR